MLSILIPTYNYKIFDLVFELKNQCDCLDFNYEIICQDDNSNSIFNIENEKINRLENCQFKTNSENYGRSKNRNKLAENSKYDYLLFLDADTFPIEENFISKYLSEIKEFATIVYGGIRYTDKKPPNDKLLRWIYGKKREALTVSQRNKNSYLSFLTLNFLIHKEVFKKINFNESIPNLRHEDTLFSYELMKKNIPIKHIENPVFHFGLDEFNSALKKEHESLIALKNLLENKLLSPEYLKISNLYFIIKKYQIRLLILYSFKILKPVLLKNISSSKPSLVLFDIYRVGYMCSL
jgi:glycosyltransferase involved in cell wall biosynthesis